jgi:predicted protein tyrosine phosphatase
MIQFFKYIDHWIRDYDPAEGKLVVHYVLGIGLSAAMLLYAATSYSMPGATELFKSTTESNEGQACYHKHLFFVSPNV